MDINETKQALSYIYSTHLNAPKLSADDKKRVVMSYFRVLYKYSLHDVLCGIDKASGTDKGFVPTPYDIEKCIDISINPDLFLPDEYFTLDSECAEYKGVSLPALYYQARAEYNLAENTQDKENLGEVLRRIKRRMEINQIIIPMFSKAVQDAEDYYFSTNSQKGLSHESNKETNYLRYRKYTKR